MSENKYNPSYKIYKANFKDYNRGAASSWELNPNTCNFFITIAKQSKNKSNSGNAVFEWKDNSQTFKLNENDLANVLLVLSGERDFIGEQTEKSGQKGSGLFHKNKNGNSILKIYKMSLDDKKSFGMEISSQKNNGYFRSGHMISESEAKILCIIIEDCIRRLFNC